MKKSTRFETLVEIADDHVDESARAVAEARELLARQESRLEELIDYRRQYEENGDETVTTGPFSLSNARAFQSQLDEAVRQQRSNVSNAQQEFEVRLETWRVRKREASALQRYTDRQAADENRHAARNEQKAADEAAQNRGLHRPESD